MKKILTVLLLGLILGSEANATIYEKYSVSPIPSTQRAGNVVQVDREKGYYVDNRGQIPEYQRIAPPNPDKIPTVSKPGRTVTNFSKYYDVNIAGIRRNPWMTPVVPKYNANYSERRIEPYTKEQFMDVWCSGTKDYKHGACVSENYYIYFHPVRNWAIAVSSIPFRSHKAKSQGKKIGFFFYVEDLGLDAPYMHDAKSWSELYNLPVFYGTIDAYIPNDWII